MKKLCDWFLQNRRYFPWRDNATAYQVWISEVMLQQTQAARVIGFYDRWMKRFSSIESLAAAHLDEVLKYWEGLGYYSRARLLHAAARDIVQRFGGKLPCDAASLQTIKGLGPYTVGAILAFGFKQKAAAVDGNVMRVLTRLFEIPDDISKPKTVKKLGELAFSLLPEKDPHILAEALIEFGALVCRPTPNCHACPLMHECKSFCSGSQMHYPVKPASVKYETLFRDVAVVFCNDAFLLRQGRKGIACTGLFEFPYFDCLVNGTSFDLVQEKIAALLGITSTFEDHLDQQQHSFTRFRVTLYPKLYRTKNKKQVLGHGWYDAKDIDTLTFSSGHKRILKSIRYLLLEA